MAELFNYQGLLPLSKNLVNGNSSEMANGSLYNSFADLVKDKQMDFKAAGDILDAGNTHPDEKRAYILKIIGSEKERSKQNPFSPRTNYENFPLPDQNDQFVVPPVYQTRQTLGMPEYVASPNLQGEHYSMGAIQEAIYSVLEKFSRSLFHKVEFSQYILEKRYFFLAKKIDHLLAARNAEFQSFSRTGEKSFNVKSEASENSKHFSVSVRCRDFPKSDKSFKFNIDLSLIISGRSIYRVDSIFPADSLQHVVYQNSVQPLIDPLLDGTNVSVISMGPNFSGKSYTLGLNYRQGKTKLEDQGIIPRFLQDLNVAISKRFKNFFTVSMSMIKIEQETVYDLLNPENKSACIVSDMSKFGTDFKLIGVEEVVVNSLENVLGLMEEGVLLLKDTPGHLALILTIDQMHKNDHSKEIQSKVLFLELADMKDDPGMKSLEMILQALSQKQPTVYYSISQLTTLLLNAVGGNSSTVLLACLPPINNQEVNHYLGLLDKARRVTNHPTPNLSHSDPSHSSTDSQGFQSKENTESKAEVEPYLEQIKRLHVEVRRLSSELASAQNKAQFPFDKYQQFQMENERECIVQFLDILKEKSCDTIDTLIYAINHLSPDLPEKIELLKELQYKFLDMQIKVHFWYHSNGITRGTKIYVGCLPEHCKSEEIRPLFEQYGTVNACDVINRYAFVHMSTPEEAQEAIAGLNHYNFKGAYLKVQHSISSHNYYSDYVHTSSSSSPNPNYQRQTHTSRKNRPIYRTPYQATNVVTLPSRYEGYDEWHYAS